MIYEDWPAVPTLENIKQTKWYQDRPQVIKDLLCKLPYASMVRIKETGQFAYVYSYFEDGTVRLVITAEDNQHIINAMDGTYFVFGYRPEDLEMVKTGPVVEFVDDPANINP